MNKRQKYQRKKRGTVNIDSKRGERERVKAVTDAMSIFRPSARPSWPSPVVCPSELTAVQLHHS